MRATKNKKTFTLIEMLIVIVIIGILAAALVPRLQSVQGRARDTKRKVDLRTLYNVFEVYRLDNGDYPDATNASTQCAYGNNCGVGSRQYSTTAGQWISGLVGTYVSSLPLDPINNGSQPYPFYTGQYTYYYGNVYKYASGYAPWTFDLIARMENANDPDICAFNTGSTYYAMGNLLCVDTINGWRGGMKMLWNNRQNRR